MSNNLFFLSWIVSLDVACLLGFLNRRCNVGGSPRIYSNGDRKWAVRKVVLDFVESFFKCAPAMITNTATASPVEWEMIDGIVLTSWIVLP
jgi:hypothetical protein